MNRRRVVTGACALGAVAALACAAFTIPLASWSAWLYGNRFEFAGRELEGRCIVFVVDRSGSNMRSFNAAREEILEFLDRAHRHFELGVVFFDFHVASCPWDEPPLAATPSHRRELRGYVERMTLGSSSCVGRGLQRALELALESDTGPKTVIYVGDGGGTCRGVDEVRYLDQTLAEVAEIGAEEVVIHCFRSPSAGPTQTAFLDNLAESTGGLVFDLPIDAL